VVISCVWGILTGVQQVVKEPHSTTKKPPEQFRVCFYAIFWNSENCSCINTMWRMGRGVKQSVLKGGFNVRKTVF